MFRFFARQRCRELRLSPGPSDQGSDVRAGRVVCSLGSHLGQSLVPAVDGGGGPRDPQQRGHSEDNNVGRTGGYNSHRKLLSVTHFLM